MKKVYICSPCRGDYENNIQRAKEFSRAAVERGCIPITPHIYLTQFMDDTIPAERELGLSIGRELVLMCDELWAFGLDCPTAGMAAEIELARELPGKILEHAAIPIQGLTVEEGAPLIHGLPISNLSDGELLELCVDLTVSKPGQLGIILVDGAERLDEKSRGALYERCKAKGLQLIATRVSDSNELEVTEL